MTPTQTFNPEGVAMTVPPQARPAIDHDRLAAELLPVLERHGVIQPGETLYGWVGLIRFTGWRDDGSEYRRTDLLTSPGMTVGDTHALYSDGWRLI